MEEKSPDTLERIQQAALEEFSEKGFLGRFFAADRKERRGDHGGFYGYFSSKEALFAAIVEPHAAALMGRFMEAQTSFAELPEEEQPAHMGETSGRYVEWMVDYICQHREPVKLLLCGRKGHPMSTLFIIWWRWKWNPPSDIWKCSTDWGRISPS